MGFLSGLFKGGGDTIRGTMEGAGTLAKDLRTAFTGEIPAERRAEFEIKAQELDSAIQQAQAAINEAEAQSSKMFVAGWRPFLGWVFGGIIALHFAVLPIAEWAIAMINPALLPLPDFDLSDIWPVLIGMLGLGTMRTAEKFRGVEGRH